MRIEHEIDPHTIMYATVEEIDESFDHASGTERLLVFEITDCAIITYIANVGFDITEFLECNHKKFFNCLKDEVLAKFNREGS